MAEPRENAADLVGQAVADLQVPLDGASRARAEDAVLIGMHTGAFPHRVSRFRWLIAAEQHAQDLLPPASDRGYWSGAVLHWLPVRTVTDGRKFHAPDCEDAPTGPVSEPTPLRQLRTRDLCGRCGGFALAYAPGLVALVVLGEPTDRFSVSREAWRTALVAALEAAGELGTVPSQAERESRRPAP